MKHSVQSLPEHQATLIVLGEESLVAANSKLFLEALKPHLGTRGLLIIDLAAVKFIDSSGLGGLLTTLRGVNKQGGQLRLIRASRAVRAIFELQRLHKMFVLSDSLDEALAAPRS